MCLIIASCGIGRMATGVVVWAPPSSGFENGGIVWIWDQSRIRKTYKIQAEKGSDSVEVDTWRVLSFGDEAQARSFAAAFVPFKDTWAVSTRLGLPVRQDPDPSANRVYKLGEGEEVKVLNRKPDKVKEGNLEGRWIQILTKDGYTGWCFDYYFRVVERKPGGGEKVTSGGQSDPSLDALLRDSWYPEEFRLMAEQERVNLEVFHADAGFHAVGDTKAFQIVWPADLNPAPAAKPATDKPMDDEHYDLSYNKIRKTGDSAYTFEGESNLKVQYMDAERKRITVRFTAGGAEKTFVFVKLEDSVGAYVSKEMAARQERLQELTARGGTLVSPTYGTLAITADGNFQWTGFEALMPPHSTVLPANTGGSGTVGMDWYKDMRLAGDYKVFRLVFDGNPQVSQVFLWRYLQDGIQLLPIRDADTDPLRHTVLRESRTGVYLFFTFKK